MTPGSVLRSSITDGAASLSLDSELPGFLCHSFTWRDSVPGCLQTAPDNETTYPRAHDLRRSTTESSALRRRSLHDGESDVILDSLDRVGVPYDLRLVEDP